MKATGRKILLGLLGLVLIGSQAVSANSSDMAVTSSQQTAADTSAMDVMCAPTDVLFTEDGSMLVTDAYYKVIWQVANGESTLYSGQFGTLDLYGEPMGGYSDGEREQAYFSKPWAIVPFLDGYAVSDSENHVVRFFDTSLTKTAVGSGTEGSENGRGSQSAFSNPTGLAVDESDNLYISDTNNDCIRRVDPEGNITTYKADMAEPTGLCYFDDTLYVAESGKHQISCIKNGKKKVLAGNGNEGYLDGPVDQALFSNPQGVEVAADGAIYVSDTGNSAIRKIQNGIVSTLMKNDESSLGMEPINPMGMAIQGKSLYVCDSISKKIIVLAR